MKYLGSKLKLWIFEGSFFSRVIVLAGGTALGQGLIIATLPILTRIYTPQEMGRFGLYTAFLSVVSATASLLYEAAIVSAKDDEQAAYLTLLSILLAALTIPISACGLNVLIQYNLLGFGKLPAESSIWVAFALLLTTFFGALRYWVIRKNLFKLLSKVTITQNAARVLSQVGLGLTQIGWLGLLLGDLLGRSLGVGTIVKQSRSELICLTCPISLAKLKQVALQYIDFPKYALPSTLINILALNLPIPIIIYLHGEIAGGYFLLAQRALALPLNLIGSSISDVFHNQIAYYVEHQPEKAKHFFYSTAKTLASFGFVLISILALCSPYLFSVIFGETWGQAGWLVVMIAPWALIGLISSSLSRIVFVLKKQRLKLIYDIFSLTGQIAALLIASAFKLSLMNTVAIISGINVISYGLYFIILQKIVSSIYQV